MSESGTAPSEPGHATPDVDGGTAPDRGRLLVVTGTRPEAAERLGRALGERLGRAVVVEGHTLDAMVVSSPATPATGTERVHRLLLRWSACLAVAETYQIEGFDAVIADRIEGDHLEDFLDLAAPEPVRLVVIGLDIDPATPAWGLWVTSGIDLDDPDAVAGTAEEVVERLDESVVVTA